MTEEIPTVQAQSAVKAAGPSILPGSDGEHLLQEKYGNVDRASAFYNAQVLDYLAPLMQEYIAKQENLFVATADRQGECDCTSKFGSPGVGPPFRAAHGNHEILFRELVLVGKIEHRFH